MVPFAYSSLRLHFSEASSRTEGCNASSETIVNLWVRDSKAGECSVVVEAGGGSVVLERRAVVIGGASDSDSYTDESGNV